MTAVSREEKLNLVFVRVADTLTADFDTIDLLHSLLQECTHILDVQAGGIMLADGLGTLQLMASTSERADFVEVMQLNAGSGPCLDCFATGAPVSVPDIEANGSAWPDFRDTALDHGFRSVFATPMRLRGQVLGTMNLFGTEVGELSSRDASVAQALADVATIGLLQERNIRESAIVAEQLQRALSSRILIEQAKGVLAASSSMDVEQAFTAMRRYARDNNLALRTVAESLTNRTLDPSLITVESRAANGGSL
jgi:GAF domain-containing protein